MSELDELICMQDEETGRWHVGFPHPWDGLHVLESFDAAESIIKCNTHPVRYRHGNTLRTTHP
jgi:hypothetical protein